MARSFRLNMIEASTPTGTDGYWATKFNTVFRVRVKTNLGNYGDACFVKTPIAIIINDEPFEISDEVVRDEFSNNQEDLNNIDEIGIEDESVAFFPNPFSKSINVSYTEGFAAMNFICVRDVTGKEIYSGNNTLDDFVNLHILDDLKQGMYYVEILSESKNSQVTRLIKGL
jgi:hypothetical protein